MPGLNCFEQVKDIFPKLYDNYKTSIEGQTSEDYQRFIGVNLTVNEHAKVEDKLNTYREKLGLPVEIVDRAIYRNAKQEIETKQSLQGKISKQIIEQNENKVTELKKSIAITPSLDVPFDANGEPTMDWVEKQLGEVRMEIKPGMFANKGQTETILKAMNFLNGTLPIDPKLSPEHNTMMLIEGGAGVGKTTSINKALEDFNGKIIGATVSDEARGVLQQNMIGKETLTIAKLLGLVADQTSETLSFRKRNAKEEDDFRKKFKQDPIEGAKLVIIDEASMVDAATWKLINEIKPKTTKIIFLGDRTQLPPIKEDLSNVFKTFEGTNNYSKLTETMRFAEGAPIFQVTERLFADNIRTQQQTGKLPEYNPLAKIDMKDVIANGEAVLFRGYSSEMIDDMATEFKDATSNKDVVVIADMNKSVAGLNKLIRGRIYDNIDEDYKVGERVRMASPYVTDGMVMAENNLKGTVKEKSESMIGDLPVIRIKIDFQSVNIKGEMQTKTVTVPIIKPGSEGIFQGMLEDLKRAALKDRNKWRDFYAFKQQFGVIDYAYAMTVHKVQGSTYKSVYVMENEIYRTGTPRTGLELNQMMRTATSRATTKLVLVTAKTTNTATTLIDIPGKKIQTDPVIQAPAPVQQKVEEPLVDEPGVYKQFGTSYRFNEDGTTGEYRQGNGEWKNMADKTAKAKYAELGPQKDISSPKTENDEKAIKTNDAAETERGQKVNESDTAASENGAADTLNELVKPNTVENIIAALPDAPVEFMVKDEGEIRKLMDQQLVPKVDGSFFSPAEHTEILNTISTITERKLRENPEAQANALLSTFADLKKRGDILTKMGSPLAPIYQSIDAQRGRLMEDVLRHMGSLGLTVDTKTKARIIDAVNNNIILEAKENGTFELMNADIDKEQQELSADFLESVGRISRGWADNSFELNPSDTASAKVKQFMSTQLEMDKAVYETSEDGVKVSDSINLQDLLTDKVKGNNLAAEISRRPFWYKDAESTQKLKDLMETNYPSFPKKNFMGLSKTADFQQVFKTTLTLLGNNIQSTTFEDMMNTLKGYPDPTVANMATGLEKADQAIKNQFMTVMMKQYQPFMMFLFTRNVDAAGNESFSHRLQNANSFNQKATLVNFWTEQQKLQPIMIDSPTGERVLDVDHIKSNWLPVLNYARSVNDWTVKEDRDWAIENVGTILRLSGIGVTNEMMTEYFKNPVKYGKSSSITQLFAVSQTGVPVGFLSSFILKSAGMNTVEDTADTAARTEYAKENNPVVKEDLTGLSKLVAKYTPILYSSNHRNTEGKSVWDWGMNTKISHEFRQFSQQFDAFKGSLADVTIAQNNWLLNHFTNNPAAIGNVSLQYLDGMKKEKAQKGTTRQNMSGREELLMSAALFQNRGNGFNTNSKVNYVSQTHADKTMTPVFANMPRVYAGTMNFIPENVVGKIDSLMFNVFKSEFDRIHSTVEQNNRQYNKGRGMFFLIPEFNHSVMQDMVKSNFLTQDEFELIWPAGQPALTKSIDSEKELPVINKILEKVVNDRTNSTLEAWTKAGLVTELSHMFDKTYMTKIAQKAGLKADVKEGRNIKDLDNLTYTADNGMVYDQKTGNSILTYTAARDYATNYFLFNTSLSQLFYGDPAEAYKENKKDKSTMATVQSTFVEYTKRLAKDIAPRADLSWATDKKNYNTITIADVNTKEKYLKDVVPSYATDKTNSTDAQELTTVQEKLDVLYAAGTIPTTTYNEMSTIVEAGKGKYYEFTKPEHVNVIMQPEKPVYAGSIVHGDAKLTDYIKSSAWALYPPMIEGKDVDKLRVMMETKGIQRANFESAKKMGNPNVPVTLFDANSKFIEPTDEAVQGAWSVLNRDNFGIQQDVPYDEDKAAIGILTQMNENITEGLMNMNGFQIPGKETMSGVEVKAFKEQIRKEMIAYSSKELDTKWNVDRDGNLDFEHMLNMMANDAKNDPRDSYTVNEVQQLMLRGKDGLLSIPLMFGSAADKFERMLHSQINKVVQVKMPGKSFVQASPVGWIFSEGADLSKVIRIGDWDGSPLKTMRPDPNDPTRSLPGQVILPFNFTDSKGNRLKVQDFMIPGTNQLDMDRVPRELLQAVGARIPNQKHSSMLPLEIVGFTHPSLGDLAIVPQAIVKQMGADFDVDKLYTYRLPYTHNAETNSFQQINDDKGRTKESMQRDYFNIHWGILTHHEMLERVLSPLDKNDLVNEAEVLKTAPKENYNYFDPIAQMEDFQRGKEAKTLVGVTSWAVKMDARIQDKNVRFGNAEYNPTTKTLNVKDDFIEVLDDQTGEVHKLGKLSGDGKSYYFSKENKEVADAIRSKGDNHVMTQSEAVDNMKNRTLDNLNVTADTYKAVQAFIQLQDGKEWAAHSGYWTRLITQPVIAEFAAAMKEGNDSLSSEFDDTLYNTVTEQLKYKYAQMLDGEQDAARAKGILLDPNKMLKMPEMKGNDFALHQLAALDLFKKLYAIGDKMFKVEALFNQDVSGGGISLFTTLQKAEDLKDLKDEASQLPLRGSYDVYKGTEAGAIFDATVGKANSTISQLFPYHQFVPILGRIMTITGKNKLSVDTQFKALSAYRSMIYSSGKAWWSDTQATRARLIYGKDSLAHRVAELQATPEGAENTFIQGIRTETATNNQEGSYVTYRASGESTPTEKHNMSAGWLRLLLSDDPKMVSLGEDLIRYTYLTGGVQDANSFVQFVPTSYIANTPFSDILREAESNLAKGVGLSSDGFITQYLQHNPSLTSQIPKSAFGKYTGDFPESFESKTLNDQFVSHFSKEQNKWLLYMKNTSTPTGKMYTRIDTLGNKFTDEYDGDNTGGIKSVLVENRALAENIPGLNNQDPLQSLHELKNDNLASYNKDVSGFDQLGIKNGGPQEFKDGLDAIRNNADIPQYVRESANLLHRVEESRESKAAAILTDAIGKPITIQDTTEEGIAGQVGFDNKLSLNRTMGTSAVSAATTFVHEAMHLKLQNMVLAAGGDSRILEGNPQTAKYFSALIESYRKKFPETAKHVDELERIRYEALNALRVSLGDETFNRIKQDVDNKKLTSNTHSLMYSLSNVQELTAHITTEPLLMQHLNGIESSKGTLLSRVWQAFMDMIDAISRSAGIKVNNNSLLYEGLSHVLKLSDMEGTRDVDITKSLLMPGISVTKTDTQEESDRLNSLFNHTYNRETETIKTPVGYAITLTNNKYTKAAPIPGQRGKIIDKLKEQKKQIEQAQNTYGLLPAKRSELFIQAKEIKESIKTLTRETDLDNITHIAQSQLQWVDKTLAMDNPTPMDVNIALKAASIWENVLDTLYDTSESGVTEFNKELIEVSANAKARRQMLSDTKAIQSLNPVIGGRGVTLDKSSMDAKNLTDISGLEANTLALTRTKSILVQATANYAWQQAGNRDEEIARVATRLQQMDKEMEDAKLTGEMMVDDSDGQWRLVNRVAGSWFANNKSARQSLDAALHGIDITKMTEDEKRERTNKVWSSYWKGIKESSVFVDSRSFFSIETGEKVSGAKYDNALAELTKQVGNEAHAKELIETAQEKYQKYLVERTGMKDYIDGNTSISETDKSGKTNEEIEKLENEKKEELYNTWLTYNSPLKLLEKINSEKDINFESHGTEFLESSPRATDTASFNEKFNTIANNPAMFAAYSKVKGMLQEMIPYLPMNVQADIDKNSFLPFVPKDTANFLARAMDGIRNWDTTILKQLSATDVEEASRLKPDEIPVMYARATGYTKEPENRSKDVVHVLSLFSMMALQHKYMGKALDVINVTEGIIKEVNKQRAESPELGKPIRYLSDSLKYFKDMLVFKKPKELEGQFGNKIYAINPAEQTKIRKEIDSLIAEKEELGKKQSERWAAMDLSDDGTSDRLKEINDKLDMYEKDARYLYGSKIVDKLISINQLKALSFNPFSAVSNFTFGVMSVAIHSRARVDYTPTQAREAWAIMSHSVKKYFMFNDNGDDTAQKVHNLMMRSNIMGDVTDTAYGESNIKGRKKSHLMTAIDVYNWQKSGDYFSKGVFMVAMMKNKMIEVTDKETGEMKKVSLWEAMDKSGKIDQKYTDMEGWYSDDISKQTEWNNYRDRMRKVGLFVFGNQDKNSPLLMKKTFMGRLIAQFRLSWFPEGIASRWKANYYDQALERDVKGRWRTYGDLGWLGSGMVLAKQMLNAIPGIKVDAFKDAKLRYKDGTVQSLEDSETDMENMRKNFAGLAWTVSITAAIIAMESLQGGDDEHKKGANAKRRMLLLNMLIRNQQDLMLYSSPSVFNSISGNALPATSVITDYVAAMTATGHYLFRDTKHEKDAFQKVMNKWIKATPIVNLIPKTKTMLTKNVDKLSR